MSPSTLFVLLVEAVQSNMILLFWENVYEYMAIFKDIDRNDFYVRYVFQVFSRGVREDP